MSKDEQGYNGWKNYETWCVNLWIDNDQGVYNYVQELTQNAENVHRLAESIKELVEENNPLNDTATMYTDLLNAAISEVGWQEIAENWWNEEREQDTED